jgi:hypothetical protein
MDAVRAKSVDGVQYQARVQLDSPLEELTTDFNGRKVPLSTSSIVLPNVGIDDGMAAALGVKLVNAVGAGSVNARGQE